MLAVNFMYNNNLFLMIDALVDHTAVQTVKVANEKICFTNVFYCIFYYILLSSVDKGEFGTYIIVDCVYMTQRDKNSKY